MFILLVTSGPLDHANSVSNIESIIIFAQSYIRLLKSPGSDESVDLFAFNIVKLLDGVLDLALVGLDVDNENQSIAVLDKLHGGFCCERVLNDRVLVKSALLGRALGGVFGLSLRLESLRLVEVNSSVDSGSLLGDTLLEGLLNCCCLAYVNKETKRKNLM